MASDGNNYNVNELVQLVHDIAHERDTFAAEREKLLAENAQLRQQLQNKPKAPRKSAATKATKSTQPTSPRAPNPYNQFMKEELGRVKAANPNLEHKEAFKQAALNWKSYKERNPGVVSSKPRSKPKAPSEKGTFSGRTGKKAASSSTPAEEKKPRASSPYNNFMRSEIERIKSSNPNIAHKDAFKQATSNWATSTLNPKNQPKA